MASRTGRTNIRWLGRSERALRWVLPAVMLLGLASPARVKAQDNFDIQVYRSETVAPKTTLVELLSNITADGTKYLSETVYPATQLYPTDDALHETLEIRQGLNELVGGGFLRSNQREQRARISVGWR